MKLKFQTESGSPYPLGPKPDKHGVNFSVFSENATKIELLVFEKHDDLQPIQVIEFDPDKNRTFSFWHIYVKNLKPGTHYAYRVDGPTNIYQGHCFNKNKVLIDPYAKGHTNTLWSRDDAFGKQDNLETSMRSVVIDSKDYDWEGDKQLNRPMENSIIYEMHVGGFTKSASSKVNNAGTFSAVIEKIPYLQALGITAVELMPVFEFDGKHTNNYWGYSTVGFFSPHAAFCVSPEQGKHIDEFRDMVKSLHKAGIEVILDVVFNHTDEADYSGPTTSFRGFDNSIYYYLIPDQKNRYMDFSGCGNTLKCNHPIVEKFIIECLEFWVKEMHVDGFRFDEASILSRGEDGARMKYPQILWNIELSDVFAQTKLIAEAWDAGGLYEVGSFPGYRWSEWNGRFRDDIRDFVRGVGGMTGAVASRIAGSSDIYQQARHKPVNSINFISCHDGFTMMDLVSYNSKHNEANGEENRDGVDDNRSWNCGVEGETDNEVIIKLRHQQVKNFIAILMLARGVPMLLSGDETTRTQKGNNNAYCQDNDLTWFNWCLVEENNELFQFSKKMINFRKENSLLCQREFFTEKTNARGFQEISWHGCNLFAPGWNDPNSKVLSFTMGAFVANEADIHVMLNMDNQNLKFEIPKAPDREWYRFVDTSLSKAEEVLIKGKTYNVNSNSVVVLISK